MRPAAASEDFLNAHSSLMSAGNSICFKRVGISLFRFIFYHVLSLLEHTVGLMPWHMVSSGNFITFAANYRKRMFLSAIYLWHWTMEATRKGSRIRSCGFRRNTWKFELTLHPSKNLSLKPKLMKGAYLILKDWTRLTANELRGFLEVLDVLIFVFGSSS